jgi:hypothetical protein
MLRPALAAAGGDFSGDSLNLAALIAVGRQADPEFGWSVGVMGSARGKNRVLPFATLRWKFAPDWSLSVGFPRTGVFYQASESLQLGLGISMQGGVYHVSDAPAAGLGDTWLDYREFRTGLSADYRLTRAWSVAAEGGVALDRRFDYYDRGVKLDGQSTGYGRIALRYRF